MTDNSADEDLTLMAEDELAAALSLSWRALAKITPWGDNFEGISPAGRDVSVERSYIWANSPGGDILCEVVVFGLAGRNAKAQATISAGKN